MRIFAPVWNRVSPEAKAAIGANDDSPLGSIGHWDHGTHIWNDLSDCNPSGKSGKTCGMVHDPMQWMCAKCINARYAQADDPSGSGPSDGKNKKRKTSI
jgi:hypothetical protein